MNNISHYPTEVFSLFFLQLEIDDTSLYTKPGLLSEDIKCEESVNRPS